jgi:hypothetical protein
MIHSTTTATNTTAIKLKKNMMIKFKVLHYKDNLLIEKTLRNYSKSYTIIR